MRKKEKILKIALSKCTQIYQDAIQCRNCTAVEFLVLCDFLQIVVPKSIKNRAELARKRGYGGGCDAEFWVPSQKMVFPPSRFYRPEQKLKGCGLDTCWWSAKFTEKDWAELRMGKTSNGI